MVDKQELENRLKELNEIIRNLNNSQHNRSLQLEWYTRDYFDILIDEITNNDYDEDE